MEKKSFTFKQEFNNQYLLEDVSNYSLDVILNKPKDKNERKNNLISFNNQRESLKDKINYYILLVLVITSIIALTVINDSKLKRALLIPCFICFFIYSLSIFGLDFFKHMNKRYYMRLKKN